MKPISIMLGSGLLAWVAFFYFGTPVLIGFEWFGIESAVVGSLLGYLIGLNLLKLNQTPIIIVLLVFLGLLSSFLYSFLISTAIIAIGPLLIIILSLLVGTVFFSLTSSILLLTLWSVR